MYLHAAHDHSFWEELLERFADHLPGGEATVEFLSHMIADTTQIYLILAIIMFFVFLAQSYVRTDRMQKKLTELKSVWGYLLAIALDFAVLFLHHYSGADGTGRSGSSGFGLPVYADLGIAA